MATASPPLQAAPWTKSHVIDAATLTVDEINQVIAEARTFAEILKRPVKKVPILRGKVIVNMFYENSTRTRTSFEMAGKYLSADTINFGVSTSAVKKGETLIDTAETLLAMGTDAVVIRHQSSGICHQLVKYFGERVSVLNAGDGFHEHPSQALLDLFSLLEKMDTVKGKKIAIVGDILHSRVARSNIHVLSKMGADVHVAGPATLMPYGIEQLNCTVHTRLEDAMDGADVVMCLRLQLERQQSGLIPSLAEYATLFGVNRTRLETLANPGVILMHPGPMNRGVEITSDVADDPRYSIISNQVANGVTVRMALLHLVLGSRAAKQGEKLDATIA